MLLPAFFVRVRVLRFQSRNTLLLPHANRNSATVAVGGMLGVGVAEDAAGGSIGYNGWLASGDAMAQYGGRQSPAGAAGSGADSDALYSAGEV